MVTFENPYFIPFLYLFQKNETGKQRKNKHWIVHRMLIVFLVNNTFITYIVVSIDAITEYMVVSLYILYMVVHRKICYNLGMVKRGPIICHPLEREKERGCLNVRG